MLARVLLVLAAVLAHGAASADWGWHSGAGGFCFPTAQAAFADMCSRFGGGNALGGTSSVACASIGTITASTPAAGATASAVWTRYGPNSGSITGAGAQPLVAQACDMELYGPLQSHSTGTVMLTIGEDVGGGGDGIAPGAPGSGLDLAHWLSRHLTMLAACSMFFAFVFGFRQGRAGL